MDASGEIQFGGPGCPECGIQKGLRQEESTGTLDGVRRRGSGLHIWLLERGLHV